MILKATDYSSTAVPSTLEALLDLPEEHFIWGAYRALLGRDPDSQGLGNYLEKLRSGCLKLDILTELRDSPEGSLEPNRARALSRALGRTRAPAAAVDLELRRSQWYRFPMIGPIVKRWYDVHSVSGDPGVHLGGQGDDRTRSADAAPEPAVEYGGDAPDLGSAPGVAVASPARLAATLLCTLPVSEDDRYDGQERWQP